MDPLAPLIEARRLLNEACSRQVNIKSDQEWLAYSDKCNNREWVYLVVWSTSPLIFCWGHSSGEGKRLRFSGLLTNHLMGKHEYRVDYFMLKAIFGPPTIEVFEYDRSSEVRATLVARRMKCSLPWWGIPAQEPGDITRTIFKGYQKTQMWQKLGAENQKLFTEYMNDVYWAKRVHPRNSERTFFLSDSLDGEFLAMIDKAHLLPALEAAFDIKFPKKSFKISRVSGALDPNASTHDAADELDRKLSQITGAKAEQLLAQLNKRNSGG